MTAVRVRSTIVGKDARTPMARHIPNSRDAFHVNRINLEGMMGAERWEF